MKLFSKPLTVEQADYANADHAAAIVMLLDSYARDPMGGGKPLPDDVCAQVVPALAASGCGFSLLAWRGDKAVGLVVCFETVSTFAARPLVNIHDIAVLPEMRGKGVGRALIAAAEAEAARRGACKVTLEVLSGNKAAQALYASCGFAPYALDPAKGQAQFWERKL